MTKTELLRGVSQGTGLTQKEIVKAIEVLDSMVLFVAENEVGTKVKIGSYLTVEKIHKERKEGTIGEVEYVKEAHDELVIKRTAKCKSI